MHIFPLLFHYIYSKSVEPGICQPHQSYGSISEIDLDLLFDLTCYHWKNTQPITLTSVTVTPAGYLSELLLLMYLTHHTKLQEGVWVHNQSVHSAPV